jgi:hypothetical protein
MNDEKFAGLDQTMRDAFLNWNKPGQEDMFVNADSVSYVYMDTLYECLERILRPDYRNRNSIMTVLMSVPVMAMRRIDTRMMLFRAICMCGERNWIRPAEMFRSQHEQ